MNEHNDYEEFGLRARNPANYDPRSDTVDSSFLERMYSRFIINDNDSTITYTIGRWTYSLDFSTMEQMNMNTNAVRLVTRVPMDETEQYEDQSSNSLLICLQNCRKPGSCQRGDNCRNLHKDLPYCWQYRKIDGEFDWKDFHCQEEIEKQYCTGFNHMINKVECQINGTSHSLNFDHLEAWPVNKSGNCAPVYKFRRIATAAASETTDEQMLQFTNRYEWYWLKDNKEWTTFGSETGFTSKDVEDCFLSGEYELDIFASGVRYLLKDFTESGALHVNMDTNFSRPVRRRPVFISNKEIEKRRAQLNMQVAGTGTQELLLCPAEWDMSLINTQSPQGFHVVAVPAGSEEYKNIFSLVEDPALAARICGIDRVQNIDLWEDYVRRKRRMEKVHGTDCVNERRLFHGTKKESVNPICGKGFDPRISGTVTGELYGKGSYFSSLAQYSCQYAKDSKCIFVAKVLVGDYTRGESSMRRPPPKNSDNPHGEMYDSTVNNVSDPTIFVTYLYDQAYPEYIVKFN